MTPPITDPTTNNGHNKKILIKIDTFDRTHPEMWFNRFETKLNICNINDAEEKLQHLASALTNESFDIILPILQSNRLPSEKYIASKDEILKQLGREVGQIKEDFYKLKKKDDSTFKDFVKILKTNADAANINDEDTIMRRLIDNIKDKSLLNIALVLKSVKNTSANEVAKVLDGAAIEEKSEVNMIRKSNNTNELVREIERLRIDGEVKDLEIKKLKEKQLEEKQQYEQKDFRENGWTNRENYNRRYNNIDNKYNQNTGYNSRWGTYRNTNNYTRNNYGNNYKRQGQNYEQRQDRQYNKYGNNWRDRSNNICENHRRFGNNTRICNKPCALNYRMNESKN